MLDYLYAVMARITTTAMYRDEEGQTAVEYALVLVLIALVLAGALATGLTGALSGAITKITNALK